MPAVRRIISSSSSSSGLGGSNLLFGILAFIIGGIFVYLLTNMTGLGSGSVSSRIGAINGSTSSTTLIKGAIATEPTQQSGSGSTIIIRNEATGAAQDDNPFIFEDKRNLSRPPAQPFYYPTRGVAQSYQQFGVLISTEKRASGEQVLLPLIGRQTYPGSSRYHYYTSTNGYHPMKLPVSHRNRTCNDRTGCEEIFSGNVISVPGYDYDFKADIYPSPDFNYIQ
jgi:hypothetical protein